MGEPICHFCAGRGFQLDWTDQGGPMRAVPGDTCRECGGSGEERTQSGNRSPQAHSPQDDTLKGLNA